MATGLQDKFSFAGVAAAGIGAGAGYQASEWLGKGSGAFSHGIGNEAASSGAQLLVNAATRSAIEGSNFGDNIMAALPDTIGGVLRRALGGAGAKALAKTGAPMGQTDRPQTTPTTGEQTAAVIANLPTDLGLDLTLPDLSGLAGAVSLTMLNRGPASQVFVELDPPVQISAPLPDAISLFSVGAPSQDWNEYASRVMGVATVVAQQNFYGKEFDWSRVDLAINQDFEQLMGRGGSLQFGNLQIPQISALGMMNGSGGGDLPSQASFTAMYQNHVAFQNEHPIVDGLSQAMNPQAYDANAAALFVGNLLENRQQVSRNVATIYTQRLSTQKGQMAAASVAGVLGGVAVKRALGSKGIAAKSIPEVAISKETLARAGRSGRQARLRELAQDPKGSSADRGWIQQELNSIARGQRNNIRVPPGKVLAHRRGFEAKLGYSYKHSDLQTIDLHKLQHKFEGY